MMFVYIHVPPNNPINACAPSSGPRLSLFSKVRYVLKMKQTRLLIFICNRLFHILHLLPKRMTEQILQYNY